MQPALINAAEDQTALKSLTNHFGIVYWIGILNHFTWPAKLLPSQNSPYTIFNAMALLEMHRNRIALKQSNLTESQISAPQACFPAYPTRFSSQSHSMTRPKATILVSTLLAGPTI